MHQATRSKKLVNLLTAAGHSVSYDMIRRINTSIAKKVIDDLEHNDFVPVSTNIAKDTFFSLQLTIYIFWKKCLTGKMQLKWLYFREHKMKGKGQLKFQLEKISQLPYPQN